ncbi:nucleotidyltransferase domain-containing protein [Sulfurisphaera ohwakuensis]|uniref:Polymerase beta nucleotidyltransferase domain-containing protein n=1 Tax=Sulfurisphaera ohwakuensis TaxID=69656 RepID=A0A7J9RTY7_SULOH|nr:nucleotidyltransferase domain-containing protein [Sulfurisphaera ohwakuensis]MBB5254448.1 hypothetical protein [Sulfurisphaera ohwakuensis]
MFGLERIKFLEENWRNIAEIVLRKSREIADVKEVIIFGSVIKGRTMGASDLDLALIVRGLDKSEISKLLIKIHSALPDEISEIIDLTIIAEEDEDDFLKFVGNNYVIISD